MYLQIIQKKQQQKNTVQFSTCTMLSASCNYLSNQLQEATVHILLPPAATTRTTISVWMSCFEEMCSRNRMWYCRTETVCRRCVWCCVSAGYNASIVSPFAGAQRRSEQSRSKKDGRDEKNSVGEKPNLTPTLLIRSVFPWFPFDQQSTSGRCSSMLRLIQAF